MQSVPVSLETVDKESVCITAHLVHIMGFYCVTEQTVPVGEETDHLQGGAERAQLYDSHNVRQKDGDRCKMFWFYRFPGYELLPNEAAV